MKIDWVEYNINGKRIKAKVTIPEKDDKKVLREIYFKWKELNDSFKKISTRGMNIPDTLTENAFCLFFPEYVRVAKIEGEKCSFDCISTKTGEKVQIKAASIYPDLSTFGPKSEYDRLFFCDFSKGDGSFVVYDVPINEIKKVEVKKGLTFEERQAEGKRPRFSIITEFAVKRGLKPVKVCKL
jgi:hypothetical protein